MSTSLPRILVIDDRLGRVLSSGVNSERKQFCTRHKLRDVTIGDSAEKGARYECDSPIAEVVFSRGQRPACSPQGAFVENDLQGCMETIREGWNNWRFGRSWSLLLLDMCFETGLVSDVDEIPAGQRQDKEPGRYFGLQILEAIDADPTLAELPVVIISSMGRREIEQRFSERGALDFIETWTDKQLKSGVDEITRCIAEFGLVPDGFEERPDWHICGTSRQLLIALREARRFAVKDWPILIEGETGTGKELMARFVHRLHPQRKSKPFVAVDCGTLKGELWTSELFGHKRGSYTGATSDRDGKIIEAEGGDIFLDELSQMPWDVQVGLVRAIETKTIRPLGGSTDVGPIDVRFVCATNENLQRLVEEGKFKEDLLFRLQRGGSIVLPPLSERLDDIPMLVEPLIRKLRVEEGDDAPEWKLTENAVKKLFNHSWPGNVRELESVIRNATVRARRLKYIADRHIVFKKQSVPQSQQSSPQSSGADSGGTVTTVVRSPFHDYEIMETIAEGGMGIVSRAIHKRLGHSVAIKQIRQERLNDRDGSRNLSRFEAEARTAAALQHPNIVRVHDFGENGNAGFFLAMDYIEGVTLYERLQVQPGGRLPNRDAVSLLLGIAEAVHYAHSRGVIHRDLKPKNILIDGTGRPVITDFGLCKSAYTQAGVTQTGEILGTFAYMPPEQLGAGHGLGSQLSDIYALGAILYRMITGKPPLSADEGTVNAMQALDEIKNKEPIPPTTLNPLVDSWLERICLKCLEKDPQDRYGSASELTADLRNYLGVSLVPQKMVRLLARNPIAAFSGTDGSTSLEEATAAAAALVLGRLHARIPDADDPDQKRNLADIFEELAGTRSTNEVETKASQLFAGLLNVAPEPTRQTIFLSQKLLWAARRANKRNKGIHKSLGGACLLCQIPSDATGSDVSNVDTLIEIMTAPDATETGQLIDVDYSWHVLDRILITMCPVPKDLIGFLVTGGRELPTTTPVLNDHLVAPRLFDAAQVQTLANALRALPPTIPPNCKVSEEVTSGDLDAETRAYYQENYAEIRRFVESAADGRAGIIVSRK